MDLAKKLLVLFAVIFVGLTGITTAAQRMVLGESYTNTS